MIRGDPGSLPPPRRRQERVALWGGRSWACCTELLRVQAGAGTAEQLWGGGGSRVSVSRREGGRRARAAGQGPRERAEPKMWKEDRGEEGNSGLPPQPRALLEEVTGPFSTHPVSPASTAAHGPPASGQPRAPWPMSAGCWPGPPGPAEEGGRKGGRKGGRGAEGGRRERAELASHFPSSLLPPLQPLGSAGR